MKLIAKLARWYLMAGFLALAACAIGGTGYMVYISYTEISRGGTILAVLLPASGFIAFLLAEQDGTR